MYFIDSYDGNRYIYFFWKKKEKNIMKAFDIVCIIYLDKKKNLHSTIDLLCRLFIEMINNKSVWNSSCFLLFIVHVSFLLFLFWRLINVNPCRHMFSSKRILYIRYYYRIDPDSSQYVYLFCFERKHVNLFSLNYL